MLTAAVIQTSSPTLLKIEGVSQDEILILESISGLSDVKVTQFMGDFAREESYYQGRRADRRNAVFTFRLNPNYQLDIEASDIREMLYRMFMEPQQDSDRVQVLLQDDRKPDRYFIGYTETISADIFSKEMKAQVTLQTTDAYLRSSALSANVREEGWYKIPLNYEGSADTGLNITVKVLFPTDRVTISNGVDAMILESSFAAGDIISVKTSPGSREILVNGVDRMIALTPGSPWIALRERGNLLLTYGTTPDDGKAVVTSYSYRAAWWGV